MLGKIEGKRRREWQRMRWLDSIMDSMDMNLNRLWETGKENRAWCAAVHGFAKSWTQQLNNSEKENQRGPRICYNTVWGCN